MLSRPVDLPARRGELIEKHKGKGRRDQYNVAPGPFGFLADYLREAGEIATHSTMNGVVFAPLPWSEIAAWNQCTGRGLAAYWLASLHRISASLASQINASREIECAAPLEPEGFE